jgi:rhodanese-related sulfurtransferase
LFSHGAAKGAVADVETNPAISGPPGSASAVVPETNRTTLGLYATPREAYAMWQVNPEGVHIIDVRTFEEYIFVGHADMARNIPLLFPKFELPPAGQELKAAPARGAPPGCSGVPNPEFVPAIQARFSSTDTLLMMCATGGRAAMAVNQLAQAGFVTVYNVINGLEGDMVNDPGSVYHGKRMRNGWKNLGLPWTYTFDSDLMWVSSEA